MILHRLESLVLSLACSSKEQCIPCGWNLQSPAPQSAAVCSLHCPRRMEQLRQETIPYCSPTCARGTGQAPGSVCPHAQFDFNIASRCILEDNSCGSCTGVQCLPFPEAENIITSTGIMLLFVKDLCVIFCHK